MLLPRPLFPAGQKAGAEAVGAARYRDRLVRRPYFSFSAKSLRTFFTFGATMYWQ